MSDARTEALKDAAWAAHVWIVDQCFAGTLQGMCAGDLSAAISRVILEAEPRPLMTRELCE
jgi:hypothetical protein